VDEPTHIDLDIRVFVAFPCVWLEAWDEERQQQHTLWLPDEVARGICCHITSAVDESDEAGCQKRLTGRHDRAAARRQAIRDARLRRRATRRIVRLEAKGKLVPDELRVQALDPRQQELHDALAQVERMQGGADDTPTWRKGQVGPRPFHKPAARARVDVGFAAYFELLIMADRRDGNGPKLKIQL